MMKDLSHLDKQLENRMSANKPGNDVSLSQIRGSTNKHADQILAEYLHEASTDERGELTNTEISQVSLRSKQPLTKQQQIQRLQQQ